MLLLVAKDGGVSQWDIILSRLKTNYIDFIWVITGNESASSVASGMVSVISHSWLSRLRPIVSAIFETAVISFLPSYEIVGNK